MEASDEIKGNNQTSFPLVLYIHKCDLCDLAFLRKYKEDYHTIISGYNSKKRQYFNTGKFPTNHILRFVEQIDISEEVLVSKELEELVELILDKIDGALPLCKKDSEIKFDARKYLLDYYARKNPL